MTKKPEMGTLGLCRTQHCLDWNDVQAPHKQQPLCVGWQALSPSGSTGTNYPTDGQDRRTVEAEALPPEGTPTWNRQESCPECDGDGCMYCDEEGTLLKDTATKLCELTRLSVKGWYFKRFVELLTELLQAVREITPSKGLNQNENAERGESGAGTLRDTRLQDVKDAIAISNESYKNGRNAALREAAAEVIKLGDGQLASVVAAAIERME